MITSTEIRAFEGMKELFDQARKLRTLSYSDRKEAFSRIKEAADVTLYQQLVICGIENPDTQMAYYRAMCFHLMEEADIFVPTSMMEELLR